MQTHTSQNRTGTIDQLNSFLRGELSAAETYRLALDKLEQSEVPPRRWCRCSRSHEERARLLTEAILGRGGEPSDSSGAWGTVVRLIEKSAAAISASAVPWPSPKRAKTTVATTTCADLEGLEPSARQLVEFAILPEQRRTHDTIKAVKRSLS